MTNPLIIGIAGGSGSGKSWLGRAIEERFENRALVIETDWFYHDLSHLAKPVASETNFDHPEAIDWKACLACIDSIAAGRAAKAPRYSFASFSRLSEPRILEPAALLVVEGLHTLHWQEYRERFDIRIFVETDPDVRLMRRIRRDATERGYDLDTILTFWETRERPMRKAFVEPSRAFADLVWRSQEDKAFVPKLLADLEDKLACKWKRPDRNQTKR